MLLKSIKDIVEKPSKILNFYQFSRKFNQILVTKKIAKKYSEDVQALANFMREFYPYLTERSIKNHFRFH